MTKHSGGRPPLQIKDRRVHEAKVALTPGEWTALLAEARPLGLSIAELLRRRAFGDAVGLERGDVAGGIARRA